MRFDKCTHLCNPNPYHNIEHHLNARKFLHASSPSALTSAFQMQPPFLFCSILGQFLPALELYKFNHDSCVRLLSLSIIYLGIIHVMGICSSFLLLSSVPLLFHPPLIRYWVIFSLGLLCIQLLSTYCTSLFVNTVDL